MDITKLTPTNKIQEHWLQFIHKSEVVAENHRCFFYVGDGRFIIEMLICYHDLSKSWDLMNIWKKHGDIARTYETHIGINTYYYDINGNCYGWYNPTLKNKGREIDFSKLLPYTPENAAELISEAIRMCEMDIRH